MDNKATTNNEGMNPYFYRVWLPLQLLTFASVVAILFGFATVNWWIVLVVWFLIGPVGSGVGFHRLFCHRQFQTYKPVEYTLAILGALAAYTPLAFFISNHWYHHKYADTETDPSSPTMYGFWESFLWWRLRNKALRYVDVRNNNFRAFVKDDFLKFVSRKYDYIVFTYVIILSLFGIDAVINFFILPTLIEHTRLNLISSLGHMKAWFSYRTYDTKDTSQNNPIFGLLTLGFGWHNNHHKRPRELVNRHKWWEIDIEGLIGKLISKR